MTLRELNSEIQLLESSKYAKFMRTIMDNNECPKGVAILTAENPDAIELSAEANKERMVQLEELLKTGKTTLNDGETLTIHKPKKYTRQKGVYDNLEYSFIIYNITEKDAKKIGEFFEQDSIIHIIPGDIETREKPMFSLVGTSQNSSITDDMIVRSIAKLSNKQDNYYSIIKGTKYNIPFFDTDEQEKAENHISIKHKTQSVKSGYKIFVPQEKTA